MIKELTALYGVSTPKKKDIVNKMVGDFFEREGIQIYMRWIRDSDEFGLYDYSESSRVDKMYDGSVPFIDVEFLQYDYCVVERLVNGGEDDIPRISYLEAKAKLFNGRNFKYKINKNSWEGYKRHAEMRNRDITFLFGNIMDGTIRVASMANSNAFIEKDDGVFIDAFNFGHLLPAPYRIPQIKIAMLLERVASVLGYREQPTLW